MIDIDKIKQVYGDRVLVRRFNEPEKKRGLYIPASYANAKKEPRKVWWAEIVLFGKDSHAHENESLDIGDIVGIEPIGNSYMNILGNDGREYSWVPDEHLALLDQGSVVDYYADKLDRAAEPRVKVLGNRLLLSPIIEAEKKNGIIRQSRNEREAGVGEIVLLGEVDEDLGLVAGDKILHVPADSGSSSEVDMFEPKLIVLRVEDLIAEYQKEKEVSNA